jgi:hypothetical protein
LFVNKARGWEPSKFYSHIVMQSCFNEVGP